MASMMPITSTNGNGSQEGIQAESRFQTDLSIKEKTRTFVLEYAAGRGPTELKDDEPLLTPQLIDSLGSFRMIAFIEETFPITIEDTDMVPENFETLNAVERFINGKLGQLAAEAERAEPEVTAVT
jgi:acyl carrier protein